MAGALNFLIDIEQRIRGSKNAQTELQKTEMAMKQQEGAIRRLEAAEKRMAKSSRATADQKKQVSSALEGLRGKLASTAVAYTRLQSAGEGSGGRLARAFAVARGGAERLGRAIEILHSGLVILGMIANVAQRAGAALYDMGQRIYDAGVFSEGMAFSLERFLGSSEKASTEMAALRKLSADLGLNFQRSAENFQALVSAGFTEDASKELIALKADLLAMSSGTVEAQSKIESAFEQIAKGMAAGRLEAGEFNEILKNMPITKAQIMEKLAPKMGKSVEELMKAEITKLPIDKLIDSMKQATLEATKTAKAGETAAKKAETTMGGAVARLRGRLSNVWDEIARRIESNPAILAIVNQISDALVSDKAAEVFDVIAAAIDELGKVAVEAWPVVEQLISSFTEGGLEAIRDDIVPAIRDLGKAMGEIADDPEAMKNLGAGAKELAHDLALVATATLAVMELFGEFGHKTTEGLGESESAWESWAKKIRNTLALLSGGKFGQEVGAAIREWGASAIDTLGEAATGFGEKAAELGGSIIDGIVEGITSGASSVVEAITGVANDAISAAKSVLGIESPSKVFRTLGLQTAAGFTQGIDQGAPSVDRQVSQLLAAPQQPVSQQVRNDNSRSRSLTLNVTFVTDASERDARLFAQKVADLLDTVAPEAA